MSGNMMTSEHISGPRNAPEPFSLGLGDMIPLSHERSFSEGFMEEASKYLANLSLLNPAFFGTKADGTKGLSTIPDVLYFPDTLGPNHVAPGDKPSKGVVNGATITTCGDGRRQYKCGHCGKLHDRKSRAEDCRNVDLGIKPHRCLGKCGKTSCVQSYSSEALLRRHCGPDYLRVAECAQCHLQLYKQNLARHLKTCKGSPYRQ